jgi:poly(3-hydroxyoctanoate) depolymerase
MNAEPAPAPDPSSTTRFVSVDGARLRVCVRGDRSSTHPPVLLIMGLGGALELWQPFAAPLGNLGFETIAFDAPGTGESPTLRRPRRMAGLARLVTGLLDELGHDVVDVLGVSLGGTLAQQLAHQAPDRVRRLVLAATGCGIIGMPGDPRVLIRLAWPKRYTSREAFLQAAPAIYGGRIRREPELISRLAPGHLGRAPSIAGYFGQLFALTGWSSFPWLHKLRQPTLVLAGDDDPIVPLPNGRLLAWRIPDARLVVARGGGHLFLAEQADEMAATVADFLRS